MPSGRPKNNVSENNDGDYTAEATCSGCKTTYSGHSTRSHALAQGIATNLAHACERSHP
jgi:hypothetical protein